MFIKSSRPCQYESIKFWYQNNFCTEKFDKEYACHLSQSIVQKLKNTSKFIETNLKQIQK